MTLIHCAPFRTTVRLATLVTSAALLAACSGARPGAAGPTTAPSVPATAAAPTATPALSRTPAPSTQPEAWAEVSPGPVAPGTYSITDPPDTGVTRLTFTLPAGWTTADIVAKDPGTPGEVMFTTWVVTDIFPDACKWSDSELVNVG